MGKYVTLDLAKKHLNVEESYTEDDSYIEMLIEVAEGKVAKILCVTVEGLASIDGGESIPVPLMHLILLYLGTSYANRESAIVANLRKAPHSAEEIINLYRNYSS